MVKGLHFGGLRIPSMLFADDVFLLASSGSDLHWISSQCEASGVTIST